MTLTIISLQQKKINQLKMFLLYKHYWHNKEDFCNPQKTSLLLLKIDYFEVKIINKYKIVVQPITILLIEEYKN